MKQLMNQQGMNFKRDLLEQYKLYVESADKISSRRDSANHFYLTLNSALFVIAGYSSWFKIEPLISLIFPLIGLFVSIYWFKTIKAYRSLNSAKFKIIHELEEYLPASLFSHEWGILGEGKTKAHTRLTKIEERIPKLFAVLYLILIFVFLAPYLKKLVMLLGT